MGCVPDALPRGLQLPSTAGNVPVLGEAQQIVGRSWQEGATPAPT